MSTATHRKLRQTQAENERLREALDECFRQLRTLANETYWTLHALPPTENGVRPRDLDAGLIAKEIIDGERVPKTRAALEGKDG